MESQRITSPKVSRTIEVAKKKPDDTTPSITELLQQSKDPGVQRKASAPVIQRMLYTNPKDAAELVGNQWALQEGGTPQSVAGKLDQENKDVGGNVHADPNFFTTVGFEFEFIQLKDEGKETVLENVVHAELGKSTEPFGYTGLPFTLETDAAGSIELVTPPFIIDTLPGTSIPEAEDVQKVSDLMETGLSTIVDGNAEKNVEKAGDIEAMIGGLNKVMGITFYGLYSKLTAENMLGPMSPELAKEEVVGKEKNRILDWDDLKGLKVRHSHKGGEDIPSGIVTQVNIAMTEEDYEKVADMPNVLGGTFVWGDYAPKLEAERQKIEKKLSRFILWKDLLKFAPEHEGHFKFLVKEIAWHLINTFALPSMQEHRTEGEAYWTKEKKEENRIHPDSNVKDLRGVWFKDSIRSLAIDIFKDCPGCIEIFIIALSKLIDEITDIKVPIKQPLLPNGKLFEGIPQSMSTIDGKNIKGAIENLIAFLGTLASNRDRAQVVEDGRKRGGLGERGEDLGAFDIRPDTQLPSSKLPVAPGLAGKRLHVVESRYRTSKEMVEKLKELKEKYSEEMILRL